MFLLTLIKQTRNKTKTNPKTKAQLIKTIKMSKAHKKLQKIKILNYRYLYI